MLARMWTSLNLNVSGQLEPEVEPELFVMPARAIIWAGVKSAVWGGGACLLYTMLKGVCWNEWVLSARLRLRWISVPALLSMLYYICMLYVPCNTYAFASWAHWGQTRLPVLPHFTWEILGWDEPTGAERFWNTWTCILSSVLMQLGCPLISLWIQASPESIDMVWNETAQLLLEAFSIALMSHESSYQWDYVDENRQGSCGGMLLNMCCYYQI
jgi:hypothetical protein